MIYLTLDTCVWLELLKIDFNNRDNLFEEFCFWIENKHIIHVVPENMIKEWNRNKIKKSDEIINHFRKLKENDINLFKNTPELVSTYQPDVIKENVIQRIERIDLIMNSLSEKAIQTNSIITEAVTKNLECFAPNHRKDSFRDSINILTLINHLKTNGYIDCYFSTLNYQDFSVDGGSKYDLHSQLSEEFTCSNLKYVYFDEKENFGKKLINILRKNHSLPSFQEYLKEIQEKEQKKILEEKKDISVTYIDNPDKDYLENIKYIDQILLKKNKTAFENEIIKLLIQRHECYKQYFLKNVGNDGMV
jgi:hypothetical protein